MILSYSSLQVESNYIDQVAAAKKETHMVMESKDKEVGFLWLISIFGSD